MDKVKFHNKEYDVVGIMSYFSKYKRMTKINKINIPNKLIFMGNKVFVNMKIMCPIIFPSTISIVYNSFYGEINDEMAIYSYLYFEKNQNELYWIGKIPYAPLFFEEDITNVFFDRLSIERRLEKYEDNPHDYIQVFEKYSKDQIIFFNGGKPHEAIPFPDPRCAPAGRLRRHIRAGG